MADLNSIAYVLDQEVARSKALVDASNVLKQLGNLQVATESAAQAHADITAKIETAKTELASVREGATVAMNEAGAHVEAAKAQAEQHVTAAKTQAEGILSAARAGAEKLWAEFHLESEKVKDSVLAEIEKLRGDAAATAAQAKVAADRLAGLQAQVDAAQAKLDAIRAAASQLAA